jgi:hypothetical protein
LKFVQLQLEGFSDLNGFLQADRQFVNLPLKLKLLMPPGRLLLFNLTEQFRMRRTRLFQSRRLHLKLFLKRLFVQSQLMELIFERAAGGCSFCSN